MTIGEDESVRSRIPEERVLREAGSATQSRFWVFTLNNYTPAECERLDSLVSEGRCSYLCYGEEIGAGGTPHLQGYIELSSRQRRGQLSGLDGLRRCWIDLRRGSSSQAIAYCQKEGKFKEFGTPSVSRQGSRSDLADIAERIEAGDSLSVIARSFPVQWIRYHGGITSFFSQLRRRTASEALHAPRWPRPPVIHSMVMYGPSGCGKTTAAKGYLPGALWVTHLDGLAYFDSGIHTGIIFDDMSFKHLPRESQIHLLDWDEPRDIHIRYRTVHIPANTVKIFTCNSLQDVFLYDPAICRRYSTMECSLIEQ